MVLFAESLKQLGGHMWSQLTHAATLFSDQSELGSKVPWGLIMSYHTCLDLITCYISVYCKLSETVLSSISLWQDSSSKTDLPEDLESQQEDSGWLCPATAAVDFAVEVVEAFLATLGKMCRVAQAGPCLQSLQSCSFTLLWDHWRSQSALQYLLIRSRED